MANNATVPNVVGLTQSAADAAITGTTVIAGLTDSTTTQTSTTVAQGNVISQNPSAGSSVAQGSNVALVISAGPPPPPPTNTVTMGVTSQLADVGGWNGNSGIVNALKATLATPGTLASMSIYCNTVAGTMTLAVYDAKGASGAPLNLLATSSAFTPVTGWNTVTMPGISLLAGSYSLAFIPSSNTTDVASDETNTGVTDGRPVTGTTMPSVYPSGGVLYAERLSIYATVNVQGTSQVAVPNVVGFTESAADAAITGAGLVVGTDVVQSSATVPSGSVISTSPTAGTLVNNGSTVTETISTGIVAGPTIFAGNTVVNLNTPGNLDTLVTATSNTSYILAAGTWTTNGNLPFGNSMQFIGQNPDRNTDTTIIKLNATSANWDIFRVAGGSLSTLINKWECWNLTLDLNFQNRTDNAVMKACFGIGSNLLFSNCHIINMGSNLSGTEEFTIFWIVDDPSTASVSNCHVEHCRFAMATSRNSGGVSVVMLPARNGDTDCALIDCTFDQPTDTNISYYHCVTGGTLIKGNHAALGAIYGAFWYLEPGSGPFTVNRQGATTTLDSNVVSIPTSTHSIDLFQVLWNPGFTTDRLGAYVLQNNQLSVSDGNASFARVDQNGTAPTNLFQSVTLTNNLVTGPLASGQFWFNNSAATVVPTETGNTLNGNPVS